MRAALIPVKELAQAKMRLADVLECRARSELALAMLTDVITACRESASFDVIAVVSSDTEALWHARELGSKPIAEPAALHATSGAEALNTGLTFAARYLHRRTVWSDLRKGVILTAVGLGLSFWSMLDDGTPNSVGLILLFVGVGYTLLWFFEDRTSAPPRNSGTPPPGAA